MLKLKKVTRITTTVLLIVLVSLPIAAFKVPNVSALDHIVIHPYIAEKAAKILFDDDSDSDMHNEIYGYVSDNERAIDQIMKGATDEDITDHIYGEIKWIKQIPHYWNTDGGPLDRVKNIWGEDDKYDNAYMKSWRLFKNAYDDYTNGDYSVAYERLGHVVHLIGDMIPSHVHEDFHTSLWGITIPGAGDDCYEDWMRAMWPTWGDGPLEWVSKARAEGLVKFPADVEVKMRQGNWTAGLYYLMYTAAQTADYFASDDVDGDTYDPEGWMDYSGFPNSPITTDDLENNDHDQLGDTVGDNDNDGDEGDLSAIAMRSFVYNIRAVATLYKMFYELTHDPIASVTILQPADLDHDTYADHRFVRLQLTYDVGAPKYYRDLEAQFKNEVGDWTDWMEVGAQPGGRIVSWILSEGNGTKIVHYKVRNLMGLTAEDSDTIDLRAWRMPQLFHYSFTATGAQSVDYVVSAAITNVYIISNPPVDGEAGDPLVRCSLEAWLEVEGYGTLAGPTKFPPSGEHFDVVEPPAILPGSPDPIFEFVPCLPGDRVRLCTRGTDSLGADSGGDLMFTAYMSSVCSDYLELPRRYSIFDAPGVWHFYFPDEFIEAYYSTRLNGEENPYYAIRASLGALYKWEPCETMYEDPQYPLNPTFVEYGADPEYVTSSSLLTPIDWSTRWTAQIYNPAIGYWMTGPNLYAWAKNPEPDMVIAVLSPVDFNITTPSNHVISSKSHIWPLGNYWELRNNATDVSILRGLDRNKDGQEEPIDLNGDGETDALIVFDKKEVGDYKIQVAPSVEAYPSDTFSIAVLSSALPNKAGFLSQDVPVSEIPAQPLIMTSTADGKLILPPRADAGGPYQVTEGTPVKFDASGSTDPDPDYTSALLYRWDFENDGTWDTAWSSIPTASHRWDNDWAGTAKVMVRRVNASNIATSIATVSVSNAAPTVDAGPDHVASPGDEVHFSGSVIDPGITDGHTMIWDFGDGHRLATLEPIATHFYSAAKKYTVTLTVMDYDGGVGRDTLTVNTGVEVSIDPPQAVVPPGDDPTYNVRIHHLGKTTDTFNLNLYGLDPAWYSLSTSSIQLDPDQTASVALEVTPPATAQIGAYRFTVVASSQTDPTIVDTADADALVATAHDLDLEEIPPVTNLTIGQPEYIDPTNNKIYVTSATPVTLTAEDNPGGTGVAATYYHIQNTTHDTGRLKYTAPFCLTGLSDGQYSIDYYSKDNVANKEIVKFEPVNLDNTPPAITTVVNPVRINTPVTLLATVDDSSTGGCIIASAQYSVDGGDWMSMAAVDGNFDEMTEEVTATLNPIPTPDVLTIAFRGTDALGNEYQLSTLLAVYDPTAGFVTGAGWINSPPGAYSADPTLTGRATFAFVSRYQKGATIPTGHTEFQFHAGDLHFQSASYQWLVVAGPRAQFKGSGTIKGLAGEYGFLLTAIDGQINGGGGIDKFRIKIWDKATGIIIYDNQMGDADTANSTTAIAGGSILIHTK